MKVFNEALKSGDLKQIYLFYGAEPYLRRQYRHRFKSALVSDGDTMNYHYFEGNDITVREVIELAETLPFLTDRRVIIWENSGLFKSANEKMLDYLKKIPLTTSLLFVEIDIDKRQRMFKQVSAGGGAIEFPVQNEDILRRWIKSLLDKDEKQMDTDTVNLFLIKSGFAMDNIYSELEKLICYTYGRNLITTDDVEAICTGQINNMIFEMVGAVAAKKADVALDKYRDLLALKEPPMRILFLIAREFNNLLQVKELTEKAVDNRTIAAKVGLPPFVIGKYISQSRNFSAAALQNAVLACVEAEESIKTGNMSDRISVELLIVKNAG
ncbi:MAG: DNA polymerase III subunit delta [Lachnospiraceae bacterium]|jgi:DNA polymerase-3 subunit delta|nr:DNA polymerase III subunit delta [Lachnospiraceae bacterium]